MCLSNERLVYNYMDYKNIQKLRPIIEKMGTPSDQRQVRFSSLSSLKRIVVSDFPRR